MTVEATRPLRLRTTLYRACQRCGGTLRLEREVDTRLDEGDIYYTCLQCGRETPVSVVIKRMQASPGYVA